jgi:hypothetical protein
MLVVRRQRRAASASALAYNLANFLQTLALPEAIKQWSLTSLLKNSSKIGAKGVLHGRWPKPRCQGDCSMRYCGRSGNYGHSYHRRLREPSMVMLPRAPDGRSASKARPVRAAQGAGRLSEPRFY